MEFTYLGQSSFKLRSRTAALVTDPFNPDMMKMKFPSVSADIVTISHYHQDHSFVEGVSGNPLIIRGPGEYEVKGIRIYGIKTYHDSQKGEKRGVNTVYQIKMSNMSIVHCGDLGHKFSDSQVEQLDNVDILMIPVGGVYTINHKQAAEIVSQLEPAIVIPMHYKTAKHKKEDFEKMSTLEDFLKEMGKENVEQVSKFTVTRDKLPVETSIIVFK